MGNSNNNYGDPFPQKVVNFVKRYAQVGLCVLDFGYKAMKMIQ